jgi:hypothetical protein
VFVHDKFSAKKDFGTNSDNWCAEELHRPPRSML